MIWLVIGVLILLSILGGICFLVIYSYNDDPFMAGLITACYLGLVVLVVAGIGLATYGMVEVLG